MNREIKLKELQSLWEKADNDVKKRARNIYGCKPDWFRRIVLGKTSNGGDITEDVIEQGLQATKQAFKDQAKDVMKFAEKL